MTKQYRTASSWGRWYAAEDWSRERARKAMDDYGCPDRVIRWALEAFVEAGGTESI